MKERSSRTLNDRPARLQTAHSDWKAPAKRKLGKLTDADIAQQGLARLGESWEAARARLNQIPLEP